MNGKDNIQEDGNVLIEKNGETRITIKPHYDQLNQKLLIVWICLWTLVGLALIYQLFLLQNDGIKTFLLVWLAFWAYFEFKVIYAYRWRIYGKEIIEIQKDKIVYSKLISARGIPIEYEKDQIRQLDYIEDKSIGFFQQISAAYWNPGKEKIQFLYGGKTIRFGMELKESEARNVVSVLKSVLRG